MPSLGYVFHRVIASCLIFTGSAIAQAPYGFQHVTTRETAAHVLYDPAHQRFYGTVPGEGAVYVISETTGGLLQTISVPSAYGLDLSVDGTRLYVSSNVSTLGYASAQMIFVVDTATLHIVDVIRPTVSNQPSAFVDDNVPGLLASLSNGDLAYTATSIGVTGGTIDLYDPSKALSTSINSTNYDGGSLYKAASGNGFVSVSGNSAAEEVSVYDTASGTYTANANFSTTNNGDVVMSPDGSMVLLGGHILCSRSLQEIADLAVSGQPTTLAWTSQGSGFSPDGTKIYVASSLNTTVTLAGGETVSYSNPVVYIFNSSTHQLLATVPLPEGSAAFQTGYNGMAVGSSGKALLIDNAGFLELNPTTAPVNLPPAYSQSFSGNQTMSPDAGNATAPQSTTANGAGFRTGATVYFGQNAVSSSYVSTNVYDVQPPSGAPGFVDVSILFPDGWALLAPQGYSYGPVIRKQTETAGSSAGGTTVTLYGNGFDGASGYPTVLVGGQSATVTAANSIYVTFTTPAGAIGPADIQLTSKFGTTTATGAFTYVSQQLIPSLLSNQMLVDNTRNQLYVADGNSGNVYLVNSTTLAASVLFSPASGGATSIAMTPDGSELLVGASSGTIDIIDLATGKDVKAIIATPGNMPGTFYPYQLVATANGTALVSLVSPMSLDSGEVVEVNLSTGDVSIMLTNTIAETLFAPSADGTIIYIAQSSRGGSSGGPITMWSSAIDGVIKSGVVGEFGAADLSTPDLGDRVMDNCYTSDQVDSWLRFATVCAPDTQLAGSRSPVFGSTIHSSGSLGYRPTTNGVEIFDIHHGQTVLSIGDADGSLAGIANLAISHDGSRLYVAQPNGIGVITLATVPLSIGSLTPSSGSANGGQTVVLRGSGFARGATVTVDGNPAGVQFIDTTQLILTMPAVTAAKDIVTVTNPGGMSYSLDAAWYANPVTPSTPVLNSITPAQAATGSTVSFTINGTGFIPDSIAFLNGSQGATQYINATQLNAVFYHLPGPGTDAVTVENSPSTIASNALSVTTTNSAPSLSYIQPTSIPAGSGTFALTAFSNESLAPTSIVFWNGTALATQAAATKQLIATVPASLVASAGTASITISTPQANPSVSNPKTFTITASIAAMTLSTS